MRKLSILLLVLMMSLLTACGDGGTVSAPSPAAPPQEPATPQAPERENSEPPATAMPADTPEPAKPADTPVSVGTPLTVVPSHISEASPTSVPSPSTAPAPLASGLAVLPSYTPVPSPTSTPIPTATAVSAEVKQELRSENLQRCRHWALTNLPPLIFNEFDSLDPYDMIDLERVLWSDQLNGGASEYEFNVDFRTHSYNYWVLDDESGWCQDYWSEELSVSNASKRNDQFYDACKLKLVNRGVRFEHFRRGSERDGLSQILVNQNIRILNWLDITGDELLNMEQRPDELIPRLLETAESRYTENNFLNGQPREGAPSDVIEWWGMEGLWDDFPACRAYYPQLFFGRWIPIDTYGMESKIRDDAKMLKEAREQDDWPDWADQKDRDILIRLEN